VTRSSKHSAPSPPDLRTLLALFTVVAVALTLALGCSGGSNPAGSNDDDDPPAGGRVYVDASYVGVEDGTFEHPYDTIDEGIGAASRGDTVIVAAGSYSRRTEIDVPVAITLIGAGDDLTVVDAMFVVSAPEDTVPVLLKHMAFERATFQGSVRSPRVEFAPIEIDSCDAGVVNVGYPPDHSYTVTNSTIDSVRFWHGVSDHATHALVNCSIAGNIQFAHGSGDITTIVENCTIGGKIWMRNGSNATFTIAGNTVHGIVDKSGVNVTTISGNTLPTGNIVDKSGGLQDSQIIEGNNVQNGVLQIESSSATVRYNTVSAPADTFAIEMNCGAPANLIGNTVTLPAGSEPTGAPETWRNIGIKATCGEGVIQGNTVNGGSIGIWDVSGATTLFANTISGSYYGIVAALGMDKVVTGNVVSDCSSDGIRFLAENLAYEYGAFEGNTVTNNGGRGAWEVTSSPETATTISISRCRPRRLPSSLRGATHGTTVARPRWMRTTSMMRTMIRRSQTWTCRTRVERSFAAPTTPCRLTMYRGEPFASIEIGAPRTRRPGSFTGRPESAAFKPRIGWECGCVSSGAALLHPARCSRPAQARTRAPTTSDQRRSRTGASSRASSRRYCGPGCRTARYQDTCTSESSCSSRT